MNDKNNRCYTLQSMNLELTTACPLRCPQCYCSLEGGKHLPLELAERRILEAEKLGLRELNLSGGETLCYPKLEELIAFATRHGIVSNIAISGVFFTEEKYHRLMEAGLENIYVSLNGSTAEINSLSRDGYDYAIAALEILRKAGHRGTAINWVMHETNADDFPNMVWLAEKYAVEELIVLSLKPDAKGLMNTFPRREQIFALRDFVRKYGGPVKLRIESCFSEMLALVLDTPLFGNLNVSESKGCGAGRNSLSININGEITPCRHIEQAENIPALADYWESSSVLKALRALEACRQEPCSRCRYGNYCRHCQAISWQKDGGFYLGFAECPVFTEETSF